MIKQFLNDRLPIGPAIRKFLEERQPANVGWLHTFGSALLFLLMVQILTGGVLLLYYAPTPTNAWESLRHLADNLPTVHLIRSLHYWGAGLIIIASTLHILRVVLHGAYRNPRELNWVTGMFSYLIILGFCFTGYLLPWDQKGYWGTRVGAEMIAQTPVVGGLLQRLIQGGEEIGAYTLSRFFALHVFFLPALLVGLVVLHLYLLRRHHPAPHPAPEQRTTGGFPFYPQQVFRDSSVALFAFLVLVVLALLLPAGLEMRADPSDTSYDPRPEWFFLAHYELLRVFSGWEVLPVFVIPNLIILLLLALPFLDRGSESRHWRGRKLAVFSVAALFAAMYGAVGYSKLAHPQGGLPSLEQELPLPEDGDPAQMVRARQVLVEFKCVNCHKIKGVGGLQGPDLSQAGWKFSREHLRQQILDPKKDKPESRMPSFQGEISERDLQAVIEYLSLML